MARVCKSEEDRSDYTGHTAEQLAAYQDFASLALDVIDKLAEPRCDFGGHHPIP